MRISIDKRAIPFLLPILCIWPTLVRAQGFDLQSTAPVAVESQPLPATEPPSFTPNFDPFAEQTNRIPVDAGEGADGEAVAYWQRTGQPSSAKQGASGAGGAAEHDNGTNPAKNTTTFIPFNEYYTLKGNNRINTTYARFKFPIYQGRGSMLFEVPYVHYDFRASNPLLPQIGGLGDVRFQISYNSWTSPHKRLTLINFLEGYVPSADNALVGLIPNTNTLTAFNLGTGKYVLGPGVGAVYAFSPQTIFAPLYFFEASVAGDPNRADIRRGKWRIFFMHATKSGWYTLPELQIVTNYLNGNNDVYVAPEVGYSKTGTTLYVKPGAGVNPDVGDRDWGIEFGARVMF